MPLIYLILFVLVIFLTGYFFNVRFLKRYFDLDSKKETPANQVNDGVDFVPTSKFFLLGQHFSAIAAAGPIVGPILAGVWFGWLPVLCWIVGGAIFFGAFHDFSTLIGSVRHKAVSIVEMVRDLFGPRGHLLFTAFVWLSLMYVITAFTDLTSASFSEPSLGGGVATSSVLYLFIGVAMGIALKKFKMNLGLATPLFIALVCVAIWYGQKIPLTVSAVGPFSAQQIWNFILIGYCAVASLLPVWALLQPRGYLGGFFLYATLIAGLVGLFIGGEPIQYPAFIGWHSAQGFPLFPILFVTVACGACSGFHGLVSSGTTSKQIKNETDCGCVGYGAMILEGVVAILALATVMILAKGDVLAGASPDRIYAAGLSRFIGHLGLPREFVQSFVLLAFTTFIYDTLDVATRLARYLLQEVLRWKENQGRLLATGLSLLIPLACVSMRVTDQAGNVIPAWKVFWTVFGTSNQLLAAFSLFAIALWMKRIGKNWLLALVPMSFLLTMTAWSFGRMILMALERGGLDLPASIAVVLLGLAFFLILESVRFSFSRGLLGPLARARES